jgi:hypothetical protein
VLFGEGDGGRRGEVSVGDKRGRRKPGAEGPIFQATKRESVSVLHRQARKVTAIEVSGTALHTNPLKRLEWTVPVAQRQRLQRRFAGRSGEVCYSLGPLELIGSWRITNSGILGDVAWLWAFEGCGVKCLDRMLRRGFLERRIAMCCGSRVMTISLMKT